MDAAQTTRALELLELQRHAMLMYTSCGWFFDDISGIEATQVIQYAGRVIQLAQKLFGGDISEPFLQILARGKSNIPTQGDGRAIYERVVQPAVVDLAKVAAHYAVSSLFEDYAPDTRIYCYNVTQEEYRRQAEGTAQMAVGRALLTSVITLEADETSFGVLHFGDHNITAGVRTFLGDDEYAEMKADAFEAFKQADLPGDDPRPGPPLRGADLLAADALQGRAAQGPDRGSGVDHRRGGGVLSPDLSSTTAR